MAPTVKPAMTETPTNNAAAHVVRAVGAITVKAIALDIDAVNGADGEAGNAGIADPRAAAHAVRTAGAIAVRVTALDIDAVDGADEAASNDGDTDHGAVAHAVRTTGAITVAVTALGIDAVCCADGEAAMTEMPTNEPQYMRFVRRGRLR